MNKLWIKLLGGILFSFSVQGIEMNHNELVKECSEKFEFYNDHYLTLTGKEKFTLEQRLHYLDQSSKFCSDLDPIIIAKATVLFELNKHKEAIDEIERGIKLWPNRKGNLLLNKVRFLYALKFYGGDVVESYRELINLLELALKSASENHHLIHRTWAEIAIQIGDETGNYDEAVEHVIAGNNIKTIYRFYTLSAILSERINNYEAAVNFISDAVKKEGTEDYLYEADTVLSLTKALCALGEKEKAMLVVEKAILIDDTQRNNPLIQESARFVLNSCFEAKVNIKQ